MSHTKGPWTIEEGELTANGAVLGTIYGADDFPCNEEDIDEECKANANLIAAAPDLLDACEKIKEGIGIVVSMGFTAAVFRRHILDQTLSLVQAIAKAKGEPQ